MKRSVFIFFVAVIGVIVLVLLIGGRSDEPDDTGKLHVVASFYPLAFFSEQIGGNLAQVTNITPAGAQAHDYEPTARDIARIERARVLVLNGVGLEAWGERVRKNLEEKSTVIVIAGEGLAAKTVEEEGKEIIDPHVWLAPPLAQQMVDRIATGFAIADPANAAAYRANAGALTAKLAALDQRYRDGLAACVQSSILTSHTAFGYLAAAYGFEQVALTGLSPDAEPSPQQLAALADFARERDIGYIFFETLVSPKLAQTIAREVGAQTLVLNPLEGLTDDELAEGKDYVTEMDANLANLQLALQCTP